MRRILLGIGTQCHSKLEKLKGRRAFVNRIKKGLTSENVEDWYFKMPD